MSKGMSKIIKCLILTLCFSVCCSLFTSCGQKEIEKTELDAPVIASAVYTGEKLTADIPSNEGYTVVKNEGGTDVGEYDVVIKLSDSTKFAWKEAVANEAGEITLKFAIIQADNAIDTLTLANWTFGETAKTPVATAKFGTPTFTYSDKEDGTFTDTVPTAVGSYFVKATVSETTNYKGATKTVAFSIEKVKATIATEPTAKENLEYTGSELELITAGSSNEGTLEYKLGTDGTYGTAIPTATNAGEYTVYYKVVGDENHSDLEVETPITVSIAKVASTLTTAPTAKTLTYTEAQELVEAGSATGGTIQYKVGNGEYSEAIPTATNAGTYTVYYKVVGDDNHNDIAEASVEVTIARAAATLTAPTAKTLTYTGSAQALVEAGTATGGTIQYKLGTDGTYGTAIPTATNAGTYTVYYKVVGDANHNDIDEASVSVTIAKANATVTAPTAKIGLVYTGSELELVNAGTATGGTIQYKLDNGEYSTTIPTATDAGTYTVYYKVVGDANHNDIAEASIEVSIAKADNAITWKKDDKGNIVGLDFTYGNEPNESTATATAGEITYTYTLVNKNSTAEISKPADGAKYTAWSDDNTSGLYKCLVTASETDNYKSVTAERWVRVHKKEQDENGVKYTYGDGAYYVSGYVGSSTEVTVASTFNDGANGEKLVTYVGQKAFIDNTAITKVVLPETVTCFGGLVFYGCTSLVSVDMRGVKDLYQDNQTAGLDGSKDRNINFWNCSALQYVIVGSGFKTNVSQYNGENALTLYVNGTDATNITNTDKIGTYYLGNGTDCLTWKFDDDGNIVKGPSAHNFVDGKCTVCGIYNTQGVNYVYDSTNQCYYVGDNKTLNVSELTILSKYNDGTNGEYAVTYIGESAFANNVITKVILPSSVTAIKDNAFLGCSQLEYIEMKGVAVLGYGNSFLNCVALKTVIVGKTFNLNGQAFKTQGTETAHVNLYVDGSESESTITAETSDMNNMFTGVVYYLGNGTDCLTWKFDDGNIVKGASAHSFENGACKTCGADQTAGITYAVSGDTAYVVSYSGTATEVYVRSTYDNKSVTFVKNCAFNNDSGHKITKIVLPESITTLDGSVFVGCTQLKYVSMVGVTKLDVDHLSNRSWYSNVYTENDATSNNFLNCGSLKTVIVGKNFETGSQFGTTNSDVACVNVYTLATSDTDGTITLNTSSNALLTGNIYYYSETQPTDTTKTYWHYVDGVATVWTVE